jgi:hypothetical protein
LAQKEAHYAEAPPLTERGWVTIVETEVEEALFLTNFASKVTVVHRRDHFRSEKILQDRLFKNPKIDVIWDTVLDDVQGGENPLKVNKVHLKNVNTGAITQKKHRQRIYRDRPCQDRKARKGPFPAHSATVAVCVAGAI